MNKIHYTVVAIGFLLLVTPIYFFIYIIPYQNINELEIRATPWMSSWLVTLLYGFITTFFQVIIGIFLASVFFFVTWGRKFYIVIGMSLIMLPYSIPSSISVLTFDFLLKNNGIIMQYLKAYELFNGSFFNTPEMIFMTMCFVSIWQYTPFFFALVLLTYLTVPNSLIIQARLDGASPEIILKEILLPLSKKAIVLMIVLRLALMLGKVDIAYIYYKSYGSEETKTLPVQIVDTLYSSSNFFPINEFLWISIFLFVTIFIYCVLEYIKW